MTNLDLIKYLVNNNPARLAELIDDIYCFAWNNGAAYASRGCLSKFEIDNFDEWLDQDISEARFYTNKELVEWSKLKGE